MERRLPGTRSTILLAALTAAACAPKRDDPVSSAKAFISLARADECKEAWSFFTKASQRELERRSKKELQWAPNYTEMFAPYNIECRPKASFLPRTVREVSRHGDTALLGVISREGTLFPIIPFLSSPRKDSPWEMRMALEDGVWKVIVLPPPEDPYRHVVEYGKFTVTWPRTNPTSRRGFRVDGLMDAKAENVEAVLLDFARWPEWMPYLVEARALTQPDSQRRQLIYGRYRLPGDSASADYVFELHNGRRTSDSDARNFSASWRIAPNDRTPKRAGVTRLTSWGAEFNFRVDMRVTGPAGLLAHYGYSGWPDEWPSALAAKMFAPDLAAEIMTALEREARRR